MIVEKKGFLGIGRKTIEYVPGKGYSGDNQFVKNTWEALNTLAIVDEDLVDQAVKNQKIVRINESKTDNLDKYDPSFDGRKTILFNPKAAAKHINKDGKEGKSAAYRILGHEIRHFIHKALDPNGYEDRSVRKIIQEILKKFKKLLPILKKN